MWRHLNSNYRRYARCLVQLIRGNPLKHVAPLCILGIWTAKPQKSGRTRSHMWRFSDCVCKWTVRNGVCIYCMWEIYLKLSCSFKNTVLFSERYIYLDYVSYTIVIRVRLIKQYINTVCCSFFAIFLWGRGFPGYLVFYHSQSHVGFTFRVWQINSSENISNFNWNLSEVHVITVFG